MSALFTAKFWKRTAERAIKSFGQGVLTGWLGVGVVVDKVIETGQTADIYGPGPWLAGASTALFSVLTSVASAPAGPDDDPSLV